MPAGTVVTATTTATAVYLPTAADTDGDTVIDGGIASRRSAPLVFAAMTASRYAT
ncbi:MAG: hypothetical protein KF897_17025 [Opitutaceae bacterium]|nr:hypothetical protein [Opitutaceae bacterium]